MSKKHIYEDGYLNFPSDKETEYIGKIREIITSEIKQNDLDDKNDNDIFHKQRYKMCDLTRSLIYNYDLVRSLEGIGGCKSLDVWKSEKEDTELGTIVKEIFMDYVDDDWEISEFPLLMWNIVCYAQIEKTFLNVIDKKRSIDDNL